MQEDNDDLKDHVKDEDNQKKVIESLISMIAEKTTNKEVQKLKSALKNSGATAKPQQVRPKRNGA